MHLSSLPSEKKKKQNIWLTNVIVAGPLAFKLIFKKGLNSCAKQIPRNLRAMDTGPKKVNFKATNLKRRIS